MGITLKSEQKMDEMIDVLDHLQRYIPTVPDESTSDDDHLFFNIGIGTVCVGTMSPSDVDSSCTLYIVLA